MRQKGSESPDLEVLGPDPLPFVPYDVQLGPARLTVPTRVRLTVANLPWEGPTRCDVFVLDADRLEGEPGLRQARSGEWLSERRALAARQLVVADERKPVALIMGEISDRAGVTELLRGFENHLNQACVGSISEIFDAEEPYTPRGCVAQAWSVAEVLRVWRLLDGA